MNPRGPKFIIDLYIKDIDSTKKEWDWEYLKKGRKEKIIIKDSFFLEGCKLSPALLEP